MNFIKKILYVDLNKKITLDNLNKYYLTVARLYNEGHYSDALKGFKKLIGFCSEYRIYLIPYIEKCESVLKRPLGEKDLQHAKNIKTLRYFGWIDKIKYITGFFSILGWLGIMRNLWNWFWQGEDIYIGLNFLFYVIILTFLTFIAHFIMKKFTLSKNMVRCKHCGHYTILFTDQHKYHPHHLIHHTAFSYNECSYCHIGQPEPSMIWDSWDGLKDADNLRDNLNQLIDKYSIEYNEWLKYRKSPDIYEGIWIVGNPKWINYQIKILRNIYNQILNNKGDKLFSFSHNEEALKVFEKAVELNPDDANAWNNMGKTLKRLGRHEEAFEAYNKAAKAFYKKGHALNNSFRYEDALKAFDKAIELNPDNVDIWRIKGQTLEKIKRYEEALNAYDRAIELSPDNADVWLDKGHALREFGRHEESLYAYDMAAKLKPDDSYHWFFRGTALVNLKRYEEAQEANDKAIELDPDNIFAWYQRAQIFSLKRNKENALKSLSKAIDIDSEFRKHAIKDISFQKFWDDEDFKKIIN